MMLAHAEYMLKWNNIAQASYLELFSIIEVYDKSITLRKMGKLKSKAFKGGE